MMEYQPKPHDSRMAMRYDLYQRLSDMIWKALYAQCTHGRTVADIVAMYENGKFPNAEKTKDINMRFRWDCLWNVPGSEREPLIGEIYRAHDDKTLDTALRRICPQGLERKF